MFTIELDLPQDLLTIHYDGHVNPGGTHRCAEEVRVAVAKIKPGFRLLVDLTDVRSMEVSCAPHIRNIMDMCNQKGVSEVVRIIPDPRQDIGLQIMSYFHYSGEVRVTTCPNVEEALAQLAK